MEREHTRYERLPFLGKQQQAVVGLRWEPRWDQDGVHRVHEGCGLVERGHMRDERLQFLCEGQLKDNTDKRGLDPDGIMGIYQLQREGTSTSIGVVIGQEGKQRAHVHAGLARAGVLL